MQPKVPVVPPGRARMLGMRTYLPPIYRMHRCLSISVVLFFLSLSLILFFYFLLFHVPSSSSLAYSFLFDFYTAPRSERLELKEILRKKKEMKRTNE